MWVFVSANPSCQWCTLFARCQPRQELRDEVDRLNKKAHDRTTRHLTAYCRDFQRGRVQANLPSFPDDAA